MPFCRAEGLSGRKQVRKDGLRLHSKTSCWIPLASWGGGSARTPLREGFQGQLWLPPADPPRRRTRLTGPGRLTARNTLLPHQDGSNFRLPRFDQPQSQQASRPVLMPKPESSALSPLTNRLLNRCLYLGREAENTFEAQVHTHTQTRKGEICPDLVCFSIGGSGECNSRRGWRRKVRQTPSPLNKHHFHGFNKQNRKPF